MGLVIVLAARAAVQLTGTAAPRVDVYGPLSLLPDLPGGWTGIAWLAGITALAAIVYFGVMLVLRDPYVKEMAARLRVGGGKGPAKEVR